MVGSESPVDEELGFCNMIFITEYKVSSIQMNI